VGATLTARHLRHLRGGREVLQIEELSVGAGQRLAVLGPNGSGKTTLLRLLAGIEAPTQGSVTLDGKATKALPLSARRTIGYVTQQPSLLTTTVRRNIELPLAWRDLPRPLRQHRVLAALERLGVAQLAERPASRLSSGERQRVNLARSLAMEPSVLLLDEPAAALDPEARATFLDDLDRALAHQPTTVVHVSHRPEEAVRGADQVAVLDRGKVKQLSSPVEVFRHPVDTRVASIVGYHNLLPATVDGRGSVRLAGHVVATAPKHMEGAVTLAIWAHGVRIVRPDLGSLLALVQSVTPGPGRWDITLCAHDSRLTAHQASEVTPPRQGEQVGVQLLPELTVVVLGGTAPVRG